MARKLGVRASPPSPLEHGEPFATTWRAEMVQGRPRELNNSEVTAKAVRRQSSKPQLLDRIRMSMYATAFKLRVQTTNARDFF